MNYHFQLIIGDKNDATEYVLTFLNITNSWLFKYLCDLCLFIFFFVVQCKH